MNLKEQKKIIYQNISLERIFYEQFMVEWATVIEVVQKKLFSVEDLSSEVQPTNLSEFKTLPQYNPRLGHSIKNTLYCKISFSKLSIWKDNVSVTIVHLKKKPVVIMKNQTM